MGGKCSFGCGNAKLAQPAVPAVSQRSGSSGVGRRVSVCGRGSQTQTQVPTAAPAVFLEGFWNRVVVVSIFLLRDPKKSRIYLNFNLSTASFLAVYSCGPNSDEKKKCDLDTGSRSQDAKSVSL